MRRRILVLAGVLGVYAVCSLDTDHQGVRDVPIADAWVSTDAAGVVYLNAYPERVPGTGRCGSVNVLNADQRRQAIGLRLVYSPPPPLPPGVGGYFCGMAIPRVRLNAPVDGRRVIDLVAGRDLTSRGPLPQVEW